MAETSRVQIRAIVNEWQEQVDRILSCEGFAIERVAVGQRVDSTPPVREEGDTIILPVVEEVLVIEKHLFLREEIHVRRIGAEERHRDTEDAAVSRTATLHNPTRSFPEPAGPGSSGRARATGATWPSRPAFPRM